MTEEWDELAELKAILRGVIDCLPLVEAYVPQEKLAPLYWLLFSASNRPLSEADIKRGQAIHKMLNGTDGKRRRVTMSEQASSYLTGYRDFGGTS